MRFFVVAAIAAAMLVFATAASAMRADVSNAPAANSGGWSLTGSGSLRNPVTNMATASANGSAHSDEAGINPKGQFHLFFAGVEDTKMDVDCLFVAGNRAGVFGTLEKPALLGTTVFPYGGISVTDNGPASSTPRDQVTWWVSQFPPTVMTCASITTGGGFSPVTDGNFVVNDHSPGTMLGSLAPTPAAAGLVALK